MGISEKPHLEGAIFDTDDREWVIAGISLRPPLKPIYTIPSSVDGGDNGGVDTDECCTTPTSEESKIPTTFTCPPAPKKRKPSPSNFSSNNNLRRGGTRRSHQFYNPPDLETVFLRRVETKLRLIES